MPIWCDGQAGQLLTPPQKGEGNLGDTPRPPALRLSAAADAQDRRRQASPRLHSPGAASLSEFTATTPAEADSTPVHSPRGGHFTGIHGYDPRLRRAPPPLPPAYPEFRDGVVVSRG
jgi:hypothetical protein